MKPIRWSNQFTRYYKQRIIRNERLRDAFWDSVETFVVEPMAVNDHALEGPMSGKRAFSINDEYRVVYIEQKDYYLFLDVGTHEQVYHR